MSTSKRAKPKPSESADDLLADDETPPLERQLVCAPDGSVISRPQLPTED